MSNSLRPHELEPARVLCPWNSPGKNTGVDCHSLHQAIFLTQGSNLGLLHGGHILYHLSHQGRPIYLTNRRYVHWDLIYSITFTNIPSWSDKQKCNFVSFLCCFVPANDGNPMKEQNIKISYRELIWDIIRTKSAVQVDLTVSIKECPESFWKNTDLGLE